MGIPLLIRQSLYWNGSLVVVRWPELCLPFRCWRWWNHNCPDIVNRWMKHQVRRHLHMRIAYIPRGNWEVSMVFITILCDKITIFICFRYVFVITQVVVVQWSLLVHVLVIAMVTQCPWGSVVRMVCMHGALVNPLLLVPGAMWTRGMWARIWIWISLPLERLTWNAGNLNGSLNFWFGCHVKNWFEWEAHSSGFFSFWWRDANLVTMVTDSKICMQMWEFHVSSFWVDVWMTLEDGCLLNIIMGDHWPSSQ